MTFKEILNSVKFEDVEPHIVRMYQSRKNTLGWYKIHFDMLRMMNPVFYEDANDIICKITMKKWEDGSGLHLDAYPMEGDPWEHSLTKELIISPDVKASNEEIVACCLWHTSFYGFVEKHIKKTFRLYDLDMDILNRWNDDLYYKAIAFKNFDIIRKYDVVIPTVKQLYKLYSTKCEKEPICNENTSLNKVNQKKRFRAKYMSRYYKRMSAISDFIVQTIPSLTNGDNYINIKQLCGLFYSEVFASEEIMSFASNGESGARYLYNLISTYDMIPKMDGIVVRFTMGTKHEILTEDEKLLCNMLAEGYKYNDIIFDYDNSLGNQVVINYATYNSKSQLVI